jgi:ABC-type lipoprotein release transport system permease subunit
LYLKLAIRNIIRNKKRTIITLSAIAVGIMIFIFTDSMLIGIDQESFDRIINFETGHIKIFQRGYHQEKDDLPLDISIEKPDHIIQKLKKDPNIAGITTRINFRLMLSDGIDQLSAVGIAINPADDETVFLLKQAIDKGSYFTNQSADEMLIGEGLAEDFNVNIGDYLTVLTRTKHETYQALDLRIKGILKTEDPKIDWAAIVLPLGLSQSSLDMNKTVTEIDIKLKDPSQINAYKDKLAADLTGLEILTWKDLAEDVIAISQAKRGGSIFILSGIVLIALIGISNTILLSAFERTREIGMLAAMGMKRGNIVKLFVLEGALIGLFGSILGGLLGVLINIPFVKYGLNWGSMMRNMGDIGYRITGVSKGVWRPEIIIFACIFGFIISALVSIYPAHIASKMEPTEALKKV